MKIAICSKGNDLSSLCDERFGRCETFVIFDTETKESFAIDNEAKNEGAGAGGKAVKILFNKGIDILIAPELGPKAMEAISSGSSAIPSARQNPAAWAVSSPGVLITTE